MNFKRKQEDFMMANNVNYFICKVINGLTINGEICNLLWINVLKKNSKVNVSTPNEFKTNPRVHLSAKNVNCHINSPLSISIYGESTKCFWFYFSFNFHPSIFFISFISQSLLTSYCLLITCSLEWVVGLYSIGSFGRLWILRNGVFSIAYVFERWQVICTNFCLLMIM